MNLLKGLDPTMTLEEAIAETARVRAERKRVTHIECLRRYRETHHEELLQKKKEYREANREKINAKNREKKSQAEKYPRAESPPK